MRAASPLLATPADSVRSRPGVETSLDTARTRDGAEKLKRGV